jgi:hypothetical protein
MASRKVVTDNRSDNRIEKARERVMEPRYYRRKVGHRILWPFFLTDPTGKRVFRSTGKTRKKDAELVAKSYLKEQEPTTSSVTLEQYAGNFLKWSECERIDRHHAKGRPFSKCWADIRYAQAATTSFPPSGNGNSPTSPCDHGGLAPLPRAEEPVQKSSVLHLQAHHAEGGGRGSHSLLAFGEDRWTSTILLTPSVAVR